MRVHCSEFRVEVVSVGLKPRRQPPALAPRARRSPRPTPPGLPAREIEREIASEGERETERERARDI